MKHIYIISTNKQNNFASYQTVKIFTESTPLWWGRTLSELKTNRKFEVIRQELDNDLQANFDICFKLSLLYNSTRDKLLD